MVKLSFTACSRGILRFFVVGLDCGISVIEDKDFDRFIYKKDLTYSNYVKREVVEK